MSDDFLASVQQEGTSLDEILTPNLDEQEKETPAEPPTGNNQTESAPSSQGAQEPNAGEAKPPEAPSTADANNLPFHKHPAWERMVEENRKLKEAVEQFNAFQQEAKTKLSGIEQPKQNINIPKEFAELFGEDPEAWEKWQKFDSMRLSTWEQEQKRKQEEEQKRQQEENQRWQSWVNTSIEKIEAMHNVKLPEKSPERNEFMDFMLKRAPSDSQGNYDFVKGWEWYQELKQLQAKTAEEKSNARKELAAASVSGKKAESKQNVLTPQDLRGKSWHSFAN